MTNPNEIASNLRAVGGLSDDTRAEMTKAQAGAKAHDKSFSGLGKRNEETIKQVKTLIETLRQLRDDTDTVVEGIDETFITPVEKAGDEAGKTVQTLDHVVGANHENTQDTRQHWQRAADIMGRQVDEPNVLDATYGAATTVRDSATYMDRAHTLGEQMLDVLVHSLAELRAGQESIWAADRRIAGADQEMAAGRTALDGYIQGL